MTYFLNFQGTSQLDFRSHQQDVQCQNVSIKLVVFLQQKLKPSHQQRGNIMGCPQNVPQLAGLLDVLFPRVVTSMKSASCVLMRYTP